MCRCLTLLLLVIYGCAKPTTPQNSPTLVGPIVARDTQLSSRQGMPNIHVRPPTEECGTVFTIDEQTAIHVRTANNRLRPGMIDDLTIGRTVRTWARGPILLSCPGQATAEAVELLE